jgi:hypothetical protein
VVLKVQHEQSVLIPKYLRMDRLPLSFRYYDPVLRIVKTQMTTHRKEFYMLKQELAKELQPSSAFIELFKSLFSPIDKMVV